MTGPVRIKNGTKVRSARAWRGWLSGLLAFFALLSAPWMAKANIRYSQTDFEKRVMLIREHLKKNDESKSAEISVKTPDGSFYLSQYWNNFPNWGKTGGGWPNWPNWAKWFNY